MQDFSLDCAVDECNCTHSFGYIFETISKLFHVILENFNFKSINKLFQNCNFYVDLVTAAQKIGYFEQPNVFILYWPL